MSKIVFFCIPAYGHTNPTIEVVRELVKRGNQVHYYSFYEFRSRIEETGAVCIPCDDFMPPAPADLDKKVGRDLSSLVDMTVDVTLAMEDKVLGELRAWKPDCIVSDSICIWGKLFAKKLNIPFVCSTTTFAFNQQTARLMKQSLSELLHMLSGMPRINARLRQLRRHGYEIRQFYELLQNDNDTETIVYTSKEFQPMSETFSDKFTFTGPSIAVPKPSGHKKSRPLVYISLGTVLNRQEDFYRSCMEALKSEDMDVIMAVGGRTDVSDLGVIPDNFQIAPRVNQLEVLQEADAFLTHCGMNSVSESLYFGVPMVLFPQQPEEGAVARRVQEVGAGIPLPGTEASVIRESILQALNNTRMHENAAGIGESFRKAGGAQKAADVIEKNATVQPWAEPL
ncbi:macrolide family glycosyltransferase [Eisenbergiella sp.]